MDARVREAAGYDKEGKQEGSNEIEGTRAGEIGERAGDEEAGTAGETAEGEVSKGCEGRGRGEFGTYGYTELGLRDRTGEQG